MSDFNKQGNFMKLFRCPSCHKDFHNSEFYQERYSKCPNCNYDKCLIQNDSNNNKNTETKNSNNTFSSKDNPTNNNSSENREESQLFEDYISVHRGVNSLFADNSMGFNNSYIIINRFPFMHQEEESYLDQNAINKLNHFKMEKKYYIKNDKENIYELPKCPICLVEIAENMDCISLICEHIFHDKCITEWLKIHNNCPLCRIEISNHMFDYQINLNNNIFEDMD